MNNGISEQPAAVRRWRLRVQLSAPGWVPPGPDGGPPPKFVQENRFDRQTRAYGDLTISLREVRREPSQSAFQWPTSELVTDIDSNGEPLAVVVEIGPQMQVLADLLSFQIGAPVIWGQLDMIDVTPPVVEGEDRDFVISATPAFDLNIRGFPGAGVRGNRKAALPPETRLDQSVADALHWYTKSLQSDFLHDQFIALWVAVELLCDRSSVSVIRPYQNTCGHVIEQCPTCGRTTSREVRGETLRLFLSERLHVDLGASRKLWRMRQMLHGDITFDKTKLQDLPSLVATLRVAVTGALSEELSCPGYPTPSVDDSSLTGHPAIVASGCRRVGPQDMESL